MNPIVGANTAIESRLTGVPADRPVMPASEPDTGSFVCSSAHGTSFIAPWFMLACVLSDRGTLSHFSAGNVLQACTILVPQTPVHDRPEMKKNNSTTDM